MQSKELDQSWNTNHIENKFSLSLTKLDDKKEVGVGRSDLVTEASPVKRPQHVQKVQNLDLGISQPQNNSYRMPMRSGEEIKRKIQGFKKRDNMAWSLSSHDKIIPLTAKQSQEIEKFKSYVSKIETQTLSFNKSQTFQVLPVFNKTIHNLKVLTGEFSEFEPPDPLMKSNFFVTETRKLEQKRKKLHSTEISRITLKDPPKPNFEFSSIIKDSMIWLTKPPSLPDTQKSIFGDEVVFLSRFKELINAPVIPTPDQPLMKLAFQALQDLAAILPKEHVMLKVFDRALAEIKKGIFMNRADLPEDLQNEIESADIDPQTMSNPW